MNDVDGRAVVVLEVRGPHKPYRTKGGRYYVRAGPTKQDASQGELLRLMQRVGLFRFDETPVAGTSVADLDWPVFERYYRALSGEPVSQADLGSEELLRGAFVLAECDRALCLTVAGPPVFRQNPQRYLYQSRLSALRFVGDDVSETMADTQEITGTLPQIIDGAVSFAIRNTPTRAQIRGLREEEFPQYPKAALRELVVNAVAHRDYSIEGAQIRLIIFDHRLELYSPGRLPNAMTLANLRHYNHIAAQSLDRSVPEPTGLYARFRHGHPAGHPPDARAQRHRTGIRDYRRGAGGPSPRLGLRGPGRTASAAPAETQGPPTGRPYDRSICARCFASAARCRTRAW